MIPRETVTNRTRVRTRKLMLVSARRGRNPRNEPKGRSDRPVRVAHNMDFGRVRLQDY